MFETLRNVWKIEELRKKVLYTVFMLILYRLLCVVPVPGVDLASVQEGLETFSLLQFMNSITGSNLQMYTIMAMGISPYINASIIMQLLTVAIPKLEEMNKSGEEGRKKIAQITRYVTVALGFLQAVALTSAGCVPASLTNSRMAARHSLYSLMEAARASSSIIVLQHSSTPRFTSVYASMLYWRPASMKRFCAFVT